MKKKILDRAYKDVLDIIDKTIPQFGIDGFFIGHSDELNRYMVCFFRKDWNKSLGQPYSLSVKDMDIGSFYKKVAHRLNIYYSMAINEIICVGNINDFRSLRNQNSLVIFGSTTGMNLESPVYSPF